MFSFTVISLDAKLLTWFEALASGVENNEGDTTSRTEAQLCFVISLKVVIKNAH